MKRGARRKLSEDQLDEIDVPLSRDVAAARREFKTGRSTIWKRRRSNEKPTVSEILNAIRRLTKFERTILLEELWDAALMESRRHEPSRPLRSYLAKRATFERRHGGKYIARIGDKVLASGSTYPALLEALRKRRLKRETLTVGYVPPYKAICIYDLLSTTA